LYKYIGGLTFMLIVTGATVFGVWLAIGLRTGIWATGFLWVVPGLLFYFAILYSVSTCVGYLTRSPILAILATCTLWGLVYASSAVHSQIEEARDGIELIQNIRQDAPTSRRDAQRARQQEAGDDTPSQVRPRWRQTEIPGIR